MKEAAVVNDAGVPPPPQVYHSLRGRWTSNSSGKYSQERLVRGTVNITIRRAAHASSLNVRGALLALVVRQYDILLCIP